MASRLEDLLSRLSRRITEEVSITSRDGEGGESGRGDAKVAPGGGGEIEADRKDDGGATTQEIEFYNFWKSVSSQQTHKKGQFREKQWATVETLCRLSTDIRDQIAHTSACVDRLKNAKAEVSSKTEALDSLCESVLKQKKQAENAAASIGTRLIHFDRLESVTQKLSPHSYTQTTQQKHQPSLEHNPANQKPSVEAAGGASDKENRFEAVEDSPLPIPISVSEFARCMNEIDESLVFFETHSDFLNASQYSRQFEHLRHRACSLIRTALQTSVDKCCAQAEAQTRNPSQIGGVSRGGSLDASSLYVRFRAAAYALRPLTDLLSQRACSVDGLSVPNNTHAAGARRERGGEREGGSASLTVSLGTSAVEAYTSFLQTLEGYLVAARLRLVEGPLRRHLLSVIHAHRETAGGGKAGEEKGEGAMEGIGKGDGWERDTEALPLAPACRQCTSYLLSVAQMERATFDAFFATRHPQPAIAEMLEGLALVFYEIVRPQILACHDIEELREIAESLALDVLEPHGFSGLSGRAGGGGGTSGRRESGGGSQVGVGGRRGHPTGREGDGVDNQHQPVPHGSGQGGGEALGGLASILSVLARLHRDVQERLIFRAETFIRDEIACWRALSRPSHQALSSYPQRLFLQQNTHLNSSATSFSRAATLEAPSSSFAPTAPSAPAGPVAAAVGGQGRGPPAAPPVPPPTAADLQGEEQQREIQTPLQHANAETGVEAQTGGGKRESEKGGGSLQPEIPPHEKGKLLLLRNPNGRARWFPALERTVWVLSRLYSVVGFESFQALGQEAVVECLQALVQGARVMEEGQGAVLHPLLFLVQHLLLLREQVATFEIELVRSERVLDFSKLRATLFSLVPHGSNTQDQKEKDRAEGGGAEGAMRRDSNSSGVRTRTTQNGQHFSISSSLDVLRAFAPSLHETRTDARRELESELKKSCEALVAHFSIRLVLPLPALTSLSHTVQAHRAERGESADVAAVSPLEAHQVESVASHIRSFLDNLNRETPTLVKWVRLYLSPNPPVVSSSPTGSTQQQSLSGAQPPAPTLTAGALNAGARGGGGGPGGRGDGGASSVVSLAPSGSFANSSSGRDRERDPVVVLWRAVHAAVMDAVKQADRILRVDLFLSDEQMSQTGWPGVAEIQSLLLRLFNEAMED
uniref:Conserved oligomeric Golgi complex subunit 3 n=1 Tax=Chromera velia CCMP2878 TaxID=1169474 RepID=A0A0G4FQ25_9ALVE|eukprot:Cvel_18190.t1-p1 / transcript=Cvel_18190.t1 / gene=Cvel_18190 / organism=Chromera_velia_CCMP2878 / gene_product=Conserved oligomeric Golgi complex subunit 3, putative / transcript_product=Conserved oligomeric Golgi complex subunit 3, putative / location=Cvel_scaffold1492:30388-35912(+) / protein_length=1156 / sequence_SO=supercontig / SO=protein_coding / is_pseudo=false